MADGIPSRVVWPNYSAENVRAAANKKSSDTLGKDQFLSILVTQLRNQDPMQPLQDKDFIAQMAQFTSVEQLMNMNTELSLLRQSMGSASSLIGKTIEWNEHDEAGNVKLVNGVVDSIISKEGVLYATVGATSVALDYVSSISNGIVDRTPPEEESSGSDDAAEGAES